MNERTRFLNTCRFKPVDRIPIWAPMWIWNETWRRWEKEGLADFCSDDREAHINPYIQNLYDYLGCDRYDTININFGFKPAFDVEIMEKNEQYTVYRNYEGIVLKEKTTGKETSMPQFLEYPVKTPKDYREKIKFRWKSGIEGRLLHDWKERCLLWENRKIPLRLWPDKDVGFYGCLRELMGLEELSMAFYDEPGLIEEMMEDKLEQTLRYLKIVLPDVQPDFFVFWEDMAGKCGPLLSPEMFDKYMVPRYRKVTDLLRSHGVDIILVDSDGDITKLIPLWLKAGLNGVLPLEVQAGMDVVKLRKEYGNDLIMTGGVDKRALAREKKDIDEELKRVSVIFNKGGFIPWLDHSVPPDVPYENFLYYYQQLDMMLNG